MCKKEENGLDGIVTEFDKVCQKLKDSGVDLSKIHFKCTRQNNNLWEKQWMTEFDQIRTRLLNSGADLSRIKFISKS